MADANQTANQEILTSIDLAFSGIPESILADFTVREVRLAESILVPGLQTSIKVHSYLHNIPKKNFDDFKEVNVDIKIKRPILSVYEFPDDLHVNQVVYRLGGRSSTSQDGIDNRKMINRGVEELTFHACDRTLLNDAETLVSKSWKCTTPTDVVKYVLGSCLNAQEMKTEPSQPARDYIAENIHPFQVIAQQANAALAAGNDPSFLHFMTYENLGTHHFRSLKEMTSQSPIITLVYNNVGTSYSVPHSIMNYVFPCDFDVLSDKLNSMEIGTAAVYNPVTKSYSTFGTQTQGCGIGGGVYKIATSTQGSEGQQYSCPDFVSTYMLKRQARMGLLEKDKVALRLVVPWNPIYNVGKMIKIHLVNTEDDSGKTTLYGTGEYLITALIHDIRSGGYSTNTIDCVSKTAGTEGVV
jgi:hypothetical protein